MRVINNTAAWTVRMPCYEYGASIYHSVFYNYYSSASSQLGLIHFEAWQQSCRVYYDGD